MYIRMRSELDMRITGCRPDICPVHKNGGLSVEDVMKYCRGAGCAAHRMFTGVQPGTPEVPVMHRETGTAPENAAVVLVNYG